MSRDSAIKRTGDMMLSGWKLLADHCPICSAALMSKGDNMRCPGCDMSVMRAQDVDQSKIFEKSPVKPAAPSAEDDVALTEIADDDIDTCDEPVSFEEMKKEYDLKNKQRDLVSSKLGAKMMTGWTLLGSLCPQKACNGTPLMNRKGDPMVCVSCDRTYEFSSRGELAAIVCTSTSSEVRAPSRTTTAAAKPLPSLLSSSSVVVVPSLMDPESKSSTSDAPFLKFIVNESDPSEKIGKKLLQGWALLEKCCEGDCNGTVPLMRDRDGQIHCVVCDEADNAKLRSDTTAPKEKGISMQFDVDSRSDDDDDDDTAEIFANFRQQRLEQLKAGPHSADAGAVPSSNVEQTASQERHQIGRQVQTSEEGLQSALGKVHTKIDEAVAGLVKSDNIRHSRELANLIGDLAKASYWLQLCQHPSPKDQVIHDV